MFPALQFGVPFFVQLRVEAPLPLRQQRTRTQSDFIPRDCAENGTKMD